MLPDLASLPPEVQQQIAQIEEQCRAQLAELQGKPTVEAVEQLFRDQRMRPFVLEVETDSTIEPDQMAEKQSRNEFTQAIGPTLQQAVEAMQLAPQLGPFVAEAIRFVASGYKVPRSMDDAIDELAEGFANYQPPQQDTGEDPALAQMKVQVEQIKADAAQAKGQADIQIAGLKLQGEQMKAQVGQLDAAKTQAEIEKLKAEVQEILAGIQNDRAQLSLDAQGQQLEAHGMLADQAMAQEDHAMQREQMTHDATMADKQFSAEQKNADRQFKADEKARADEGKRAEMKLKAQKPKEKP